MTKIVGFGHYSRTGKDTTADALISALRSRGIVAQKRSFASPLKAVAQTLYGHLGLESEAFYNKKENEHLRGVKLPKINKTPVEIWVDLGTKAVREQVYDNTWIDLGLIVNETGVDVIIFPDVRFENEIVALREENAYLVKVVRPGVSPKDTVADQALVGYEGWDEIIGESGQILDLVGWAEHYAAVIHSQINEESA